MTAPIEVDEVRHGGRNFIRVGDTVKVSGDPGKRGFEATVRKIVVDDQGAVRWFEVYGGSGGRASMRVLRPERIKRMAQSKVARRHQ